MHDPRVGRFFVVDPLTFKYPHYSPYQFSGNSPLASVELEGLEESVNLNANEEVWNGPNGPGSSEQLEEVTLYASKNGSSIYSDDRYVGTYKSFVEKFKEYGYTGNRADDERLWMNTVGNKLDYSQVINNEFRRLKYNADYEDFIANWNAGHLNWDPDGLGNFLMNVTIAGVGGAGASVAAGSAGLGYALSGIYTTTATAAEGLFWRGAFQFYEGYATYAAPTALYSTGGATAYTFGTYTGRALSRSPAGGIYIRELGKFYLGGQMLPRTVQLTQNSLMMYGRGSQFLYTPGFYGPVMSSAGSVSSQVVNYSIAGAVGASGSAWYYIYYLANNPPNVKKEYDKGSSDKKE